MNVKEQYWKYSLVTIIIVLGMILFVEFIPFLGVSWVLAPFIYWSENKCCI